MKAERAEARCAADAVEAWARGGHKAAGFAARLHIAEAARAVGALVDMLLNWERNGLLRTPRDGASGYRT